MEYKALSQNTIKIKIAKEFTLNGSVDYADPLHQICGNIKYTYGSTGTENQGISTMQPYSSTTSYTKIYSGSTTSYSNKIESNVIGYEIDGVTYYGIKNADFQVAYSTSSYKFKFKGKIKVVRLISSDYTIIVDEWDVSNISISTSSSYPCAFMSFPKNADDLILSITFEPSEE